MWQHGEVGHRPGETKKKEIYKYLVPWTVYGMNWRERENLSILLQLQIIQLDEDRGEFVLRATFDHPYPTTKIMWIPDQTAQLPDLVATSGSSYDLQPTRSPLRTTQLSGCLMVMPPRVCTVSRQSSHHSTEEYDSICVQYQ